MKRLAIEKLLYWKNQKQRKPLLLDGARQVGKTWLAERLFGGKHFQAVHKADFLAEPRLMRIFDNGLQSTQVIANLEISLNSKINLDSDLILFDEVGECQQAVNSLKYFAEDMPQAYICATGSNIGLLGSFPVGKVEFLELFPMCFEEFVMASGKHLLHEAFQERHHGQVVHNELWSLLLDYYFIGGMPEAVHAWFSQDDSPLERSDAVTKIHRSLIAGYQQDFGKYDSKQNAGHIEAVFRNVPRQLARVMDDSVQRYVFKDVITNKRRYQELRGPINWLEQAKLISKCYQIDCRPSAPLTTLAKENIFKLFLFDIGLLGYMLNMSYAEQRRQAASFKGFIAENFVQNELRTQVSYPTFSWAKARGEIEFLYKCQGGEIIPVEVKSGSRSRARSLRTYVDRYSPKNTVKLIGTAGNEPDAGPDYVWPLYYAQYLSKL
ncbi:MAG: ATP-binding protein [Gammaproteobacteria bacterium]|nr:ATP-binding protein [Gammaproteobacteria bacterium]